VATDGDNGAAGSIGAPWLTIQHAADTMVAGDTVYIRGGTYAQAGTCGTPTSSVCAIKPKNSGTSGNPITYTNYQEEAVVIDQETVYGGFYIFTKNYITIDGLEIKNAFWTGIQVADGNTNLIVQNNHIHHIDGDPGMNVAGVRPDGSDAALVKDNIIHDIAVDGDQDNANAAGVISFDMINSIVEGNTIYNAGQGFRDKRPVATGNNITRNNIIHDTFVGITLGPNGAYTTADNKMYGNVIYDCTAGDGATGIQILASGSSTGLEVYNNTISRCGWGINHRGHPDSKIWNNLISNPDVNGSSQDLTTAMRVEDMTDLVFSDYNLIYQTVSTYDPYFTISGGWHYDTVAGIQTDFTEEVGSVTSDPLFANLGAKDFRLQSGSPAIDAGRDNGLSGGNVVNIGALGVDEGVVGTEGRSAGSGDIDELGW
jgi:hypothetical protein